MALVEVKLCNVEDINKASKKLVELSKDIYNSNHKKPNFLMIITATKSAYIDENGVYIIPLCCLKN